MNFQLEQFLMKQYSQKPVTHWLAQIQRETGLLNSEQLLFYLVQNLEQSRYPCSILGFVHRNLNLKLLLQHIKAVSMPDTRVAYVTIENFDSIERIFGIIQCLK